MTQEEKILEVINKYKASSIGEAELIQELKQLQFTDLGFATLDNFRAARQGFPEVIYCAGKTPAQTAEIFLSLSRSCGNVLATRASQEHYEAVQKLVPDAVYNELARTVTIEREPLPKDEKRSIAIVTAGTSDLPVAEEAAVTAAIMGNKVIKIYDVGVAGIHRLFAKLDLIRSANVIIVAAGMEGALPSVVGGLVDKPVIALPTSVGYGASFNGLAALLGMLNSCAAGVAVVNIDNGFGAGRLANLINKQR